MSKALTVRRSVSKQNRRLLLLVGLILSIAPAALMVAPTHAATATWFNNIVVIAMENQYYTNVLGTGSGNGAAPFLQSLVGTGATIPAFHSYCNDPNPYCSSIHSALGGGSAANYNMISSGTATITDCSCVDSSTATNIFDRMTGASLTWKGFCEDFCGRKADHFPPLIYSDTNSLTCASAASENCYEFTNPSASSYSVVSYTDFLAELNSGHAANFVWFTPTDNHNMHDNSISTGDSYLQTLMVGSGSIATPDANSVLGSSLYKGGHTLVYLWWDEYDPSPNLFLGAGVTPGISPINNYDEPASLHTILNNWNLPALVTSVDGSAPQLSFFTATGTQPFTASFTTSPSSPTTGNPITFTATASGGSTPYSYQWLVGSTSVGSGQSVSWLTSTPGVYTVTLNAGDSASHTSSSSQTITVGSSGCSNGATNPPACNQCPAGQSLVNGSCVANNPNGPSGNFNQFPVPGYAWVLNAHAGGPLPVINSNGVLNTTTVDPQTAGYCGTCPYNSNVYVGVEDFAGIHGGGSNPPANLGINSITINGLFQKLSVACSLSSACPDYNMEMTIYFYLPTPVSGVNCGNVVTNSYWLDTEISFSRFTGGSLNPPQSYIGCGSSYSITYRDLLAASTPGQTVSTTAFSIPAFFQSAMSTQHGAGCNACLSTTPYQVSAIEIGTEGFGVNYFSAQWYNVTLSTTSQTGSLQVGIVASPATPILQTPTTFTATAQGGTAPYGYVWSITVNGGTTTLQSQTISFTFNLQALYTLTVKATDSSSPANTATASATYDFSATGCSNGATNPPACTNTTANVGLFFQPLVTALGVTGIIGVAVGVVVYDRTKRQHR